MTTSPEAEPVAPTGRARFRDPFRWIIENPGTVDAIAFGATALMILVLGLLSGAAGWWIVFTVPMVAAGALCRVRPRAGVLVIGALALVHVLVNVPVVLGDVMTFYAMFCAIAYGRPLVHALGLGAGFLGVLTQASYWAVLSLRRQYGGALEALTTFVGLGIVGTITVVAIWALANLQRARVRQLDLTRQRAAQAAREREQRTALAVAAERARIAREMHDVVAHSLSVIIAQADGGRFVAAQKPEQAVEVLGTIGETGRAALADMRSLLGVLREQDETSFGPQPGPEMLPELVERVRAAGLEVSLTLEGPLEDLPPATGLSLFRLVQESLTNVLKHAGPAAHAAVRIRRTPQLLAVEIVDDGQGGAAPGDGQGHGITGMRERMSVLGGSLQAGPLPGRGYRVLATVPLDGSRLPATPAASVSSAGPTAPAAAAPAANPYAPSAPDSPAAPMPDPYAPAAAPAPPPPSPGETR
ncbi:sensor histidine kinase [Brachybacterium sp. UNK5269]|uniref:sensor histidine kinase n=1 Tax=Brachybacterium sp. UNK5269 TaxID=3408576 RepID=UPI003BAE3903